MDERYFNSLADDSRVFTLIRLFEDEIHRKAKCQIEFSDLVEEIEQNLIDEVIGEYDSISTTTTELEIDARNIRNISELSFLLPFSAKLTHSISSEINKEDLSFLSDQRLKNIKKSANDNGELKLSETYNSIVQGNLSVTFENSSPLTWVEKEKADHFWSEPEIEEIRISLEDIQK